MNPDSPAMSDAVFAYIQRHQVQEVILIAHWRGYYDQQTSYAGRNQALLKSVEKLVAAGVHPTILLNIPSQPFDVPKVLAQHYRSPAYVESCCAKPGSMRAPKEFDDKSLRAFQAAGATVLDPKPLFLNRQRERYIVLDHDTVLYRDSHHLTTKGALRVLLPFFRESLQLGSLVARRSATTAVQ